MIISKDKSEYNAQSSVDMHRFLQAKSWEEKVRSIERMRAASRVARSAMSARSENNTAPAREGSGQAGLF